MCFWSTFYLESWKRRECKVALEAGMAGFEDDEAESESVRPQYRGKFQPSKVTGKQVLVHDPMERARALLVGVLCVCTLTLGDHARFTGVSSPAPAVGGRAQNFLANGLLVV